jgi:lipoyl(octanoyl) transferase
VPRYRFAVRPAELIDWGRLGYEEARARQIDRVAARRAGEVIDALVLVEHPHVYTLGRRREARANVLAAGDVPVIEVERGGDVTYHGPGQIVAYPIIALEPDERDLHALLRHLEDGIIATLARYRIDAGREPGKTGVWRQGRKLASLGIACRRWVTFHGLALNVTTDLSYFFRINPCGFDAEVMTSVAAELGGAESLDLEAIKAELAEDLAAALGREIVPA